MRYFGKLVTCLPIWPTVGYFLRTPHGLQTPRKLTVIPRFSSDISDSEIADIVVPLEIRNVLF